ncbi:MAG: hypothetical protein ABSD89_11630 [Halobacteriota archaeon]
MYELPKDFSVSYDDVRSVYELPKDFSVSYDDVRSVYELPKDFSVSYDNDEVPELSDNDEVRELSDSDLQAQCVRASPTCGNVSYVPACITPHA